MKVSIVGATGYTGEELLRILSGHPEAEVIYLTSESQTGGSIFSAYPHLKHFYDNKLVSIDNIQEIAEQSDAIFIGLPHGHAMEVGKKVLPYGKKIIDLGADYRFTDHKVYEQWYKVTHTHIEAKAVYGLPEIYRQDIKQADIIGNPGCYTTASILALAPLVKYDLIELDTIIIDAKSGISGAGRGLKLNSHFSEAFENMQAYNIGGHRHTPEIEQVLSDVAKAAITLSFSPHLMPIARGILSTCYAKLKSNIKPEQVTEAFESMYAGEYFVRLFGLGGYPATKNTRGSNFCDLGWHIDPRTGRVVVVSAIDNLVKGAAGQAVQNLNIVFGLPENTGLTQAPLYP